MGDVEGRKRVAHRPPRRRVALGGGLMVAATTYVGLADPHRPEFLFPGCPFKMVTGWNCPACGGLRMTHDLLHADLAAAVVDNAFVLFGAPVLAVWLLIRWQLGRRLLPGPFVAVVVVAALTWTVVRNLPGFPLVPTLSGG